MVKFLLRDIEKELWKRVKSMCAEKDETIKEYLLELIEKDVERYEQEK